MKRKGQGRQEARKKVGQKTKRDEYQRCISIFITVCATRGVCIIVGVTRDVSVYL